MRSQNLSDKRSLRTRGAFGIRPRPSAAPQTRGTPMLPKYSLYVISKGRWESRLTVKALDKIGVPYRVVIEPQEHAQYAAVIDPARLLVLPFSNLGQGSIPARNWVWEHS